MCYLNNIPIFRNKLSAPSSTACSLKMGTLDNPETSVIINLRCITSQKREYRKKNWN